MLSQLDQAMIEGRMLIGGTWRGSAAGGLIEVRDPADHSLVGTVPDATPEDAAAAVDAAEAAQQDWAGRLAGERSSVLRDWAGAIRARAADLGRLMSTEQGKPLPEAVAEANIAADFIDWFAEEGRRAYGQVIPAFAPNKQIVVVREPVGIALAITPWNFPLSMVARKVAPGLAAGCPVVLKPSEDAPFSALALADLALEAGVPAGVLNVLTCSRAQAVDTVGALLADERVRKLSFTGSTVVGRVLLEQCARTVKRVSMELGGNAPFVVFDDADAERALAGFMAAKFRNAGQVCISPNRLLVEDGVHDDFVAALAERILALVVGPGLETGTQIGPMISQRAYDKAMGLIGDAVRDGARVVTGGGQHALGGTFLQPTVLTGVNPQMRIFREEVFAPVVPVVRFSGEDEAVALANDTEAGLAAYAYTGDADRIWRLSRRLQSGMIGLNDGVISTPVAPFGGVKQSGLGREGAQSGLLEYLEEKYLCIGTAG